MSQPDTDYYKERLNALCGESDAFYANLWYDKSKYMIEKNRQSGCVQ